MEAAWAPLAGGAPAADGAAVAECVTALLRLEKLYGRALVPCANYAEFWLRLAALRVRWRPAYRRCVAPGGDAGARFCALFAPGAAALAAAGGDAAAPGAVLAHAARVAAPRSLDVALAHALALEAEGRGGEALQELERAAEWAGGSGELALARAQALARAGRRGDAARVLEEGAAAVAAAAGGGGGGGGGVLAEGARRGAARLWDARARLEDAPEARAAVWARATDGEGGAVVWAAWAGESGERVGGAPAAEAQLAVLGKALGFPAGPAAVTGAAAAPLWARLLHVVADTTTGKGAGDVFEAWAAHAGWRAALVGAGGGGDPVVEAAAAGAAAGANHALALKRQREEGTDGQPSKR